MEEKEDSSELKNITEYILVLKDQIEKDKENRERRRKEREMQAEEAKLKIQIENLIKDNNRYRDFIENNEDADKEEKESREELIKENNKELEIKKKRYFEVKQLNEENQRRRKSEQYKNETPEDRSKRIIEINEKIYQFSIIQSFLVDGDSFEEAINKLLEWQKEKYKMEEKNDRRIMEQDMDRMRRDEKICNEIIDVAYGEYKNTRDNDDER